MIASNSNGIGPLAVDQERESAAFIGLTARYAASRCAPFVRFGRPLTSYVTRPLRLSAMRTRGKSRANARMKKLVMEIFRAREARGRQRISLIETASGRSAAAFRDFSQRDCDNECGIGHPHAGCSASRTEGAGDLRYPFRKRTFGCGAISVALGPGCVERGLYERHC